MTKDFYSTPTKADEKIVRESTSYGELLENLKAAQGRNGTVLMPAEPERVVTLSAPSGVERRAMRVIYPSGNNRFELFGVDEADLDAQEQAIRALYGA